IRDMGALDVKVTFPVKVPVAMGLKRTTTPALAPAPRLKGEPEMTEKGADAEALPVRMSPPMFWTVKDRSAVLPTPTASKFSEVGVTLIGGVLAAPTPGTPRVTSAAVEWKLHFPTIPAAQSRHNRTH